MSSTASLAIDSANRKAGVAPGVGPGAVPGGAAFTGPTPQVPPTTVAVAPSTVTSALGTVVKLVPADIVAMYVVVVTALTAQGAIKDHPEWLWAWFGFALVLTIVFFYIQFAQSYQQTHGTIPNWRLIPAWRITLTVVAFTIWAFAVKPDATKEMFWQSDLATLIASLAIIVIGPLLSAVDGLLNPN
jgi:hypothetical protein